MVHPKQLRELARNPTAYIRFHTTGELPRLVRPASPLIDLLTQIQPRYLPHITGVRVGLELGYSGSRTFHTAAQALHWVRPAPEMLVGQTFPAESWRIKGFRAELFLEDLIEHCATWPEGLLNDHSRLRRPRIHDLSRLSSQHPMHTSPSDDADAGRPASERPDTGRG